MIADSLALWGIQGMSKNQVDDLIKTAPELLATLKAARQAIDPDWNPVLAFAIDRAIANAEGT